MESFFAHQFRVHNFWRQHRHPNDVLLWNQHFGLEEDFRVKCSLDGFSPTKKYKNFGNIWEEYIYSFRFIRKCVYQQSPNWKNVYKFIFYLFFGFLRFSCSFFSRSLLSDPLQFSHQFSFIIRIIFQITIITKNVVLRKIGIQILWVI